MTTPRRALVCAGNSITFGYSHDSIPYPERLATITGRPVANLGLGGDRVADMRARWQIIAKSYSYKACIIEGGTNNIFFDGDTGNAVWAALQAFAEEVQANGQQAVIILILPRWGSSGWTMDMETERLACNQDARNYVVTHPSVRLIESDTLLGDGGSPVGLNPAYDYGDQLHLNDVGAQVLAAALAALPV